MLDNIRLRLSSGSAGLLELSILGVLTGLVVALIILAFRLIVEGIQAQFLPGGNPENYEGLPSWAWFALPTFGGFVLGLMFQLLRPELRSVGVVHTIERLDYHQGRLPIGNFLAQFLGAAFSIVSGHSVGREGPAIHLGAAGGSQVGQWLKLPNNAIRVLVGCGVAAAIAASFNTPIAGVIFTIEVIVLEFTSVTLLPVILAAVSATVLSQQIFGTAPLLDSAVVASLEPQQLPWVITTGIVIGLLGAAFVRVLLFFTQFSQRWPVWIRFTLAGVLTGACALIAPEIMSIGYDTVIEAMSGNMAVAALIMIVLLKLFATSASLGLGLPAGLIGPTVFIGATAGGAVGVLAMQLSPETAGNAGFYALIGLGAMMGAVIQAPLAALMTLLELTHNPQVLLPGMLAVTIAHLTTARVFGQGAIFRSLLAARGLDYQNDPTAQALRRTGVISSMDHSVITIDKEIERNELKRAVVADVRWLMTGDGQEAYIMPASDVAAFLQRDEESENIKLDDIPATRLVAKAVSTQATLQDAYEVLTETDSEAVYIMSHSGVIGVLTLEDILTQHRPGARKRVQ